MRCVCLVAVISIALAATSPAVGQEFDKELRVLMVDLDGEPLDNVTVSLKEIADVSTVAKRGVALFQAKLDPESGALLAIKGADGQAKTPSAPMGSSVTLEVNLKGASAAGPVRKRTDIIGRTRNVSWKDAKDFEVPVVVPLWQAGEVGQKAQVIVRGSARSVPASAQANGSHYVHFAQEPELAKPKRVTVAVRFDKSNPEVAIVVAKAEGDDQTWIEQMNPTLPIVDMPDLASEVHGRIEVGEHIPTTFAKEVKQLNTKVEHINCKIRACLRSPVLGKVLINNPGPCEFDILLNQRPVHVRGRSLTTVLVPMDDLTTEFCGRPDTRQVWSRWEPVADCCVLRIDVCAEPRPHSHPCPAGSGTIIPSERTRLSSNSGPALRRAGCQPCVRHCTVYLEPGNPPQAPTGGLIETEQPDKPCDD